MFSPLSTIAKRLFQDWASNTLGSWQEKPQFLLKFWPVQRKYSKGSASTQATSSPPPRTTPAPTEQSPAPTEQSRCQPIYAHRCVAATKFQHLLSERLRLSANVNKIKISLEGCNCTEMIEMFFVW